MTKGLPDGEQGLVTARRLGAGMTSLSGLSSSDITGAVPHKIQKIDDDMHRADVPWVRDLEVCSQVDVFVANDVPRLRECSHFSRAVRARRARSRLPSYDYFGNLMSSSRDNSWGCPFELDDFDNSPPHDMDVVGHRDEGWSGERESGLGVQGERADDAEPQTAQNMQPAHGWHDLGVGKSRLLLLMRKVAPSDSSLNYVRSRSKMT